MCHYVSIYFHNFILIMGIENFRNKMLSKFSPFDKNGGSGPDSANSIGRSSDSS